MRTAYWRTESSCFIRRSTAEKKMPWNKIWKFRRCKFEPYYLSAQDASLRQYNGAAQVYPSLVLQHISLNLYRQQFAAFCPFVWTLPIDFALLWRKWKYIKSKMTAKLREKRTFIAAVRDILWTCGTFPTPFLSRYWLPLNEHYHESSMKRFQSP